MRWPPLSLALVLAPGLALVACAQSSAEKGAPKEEKAVLESVDAQMLMARVRASGAPFIFVNAWATWCQPCIEEFPELVRFQKAHPPPEAELLFVSTDFSSEADKAAGFFQSSGASKPGYLKKGGDMEFIDGLSKRWSGALPATFLFDRQGNLLELWQSKVSFEKLEEALVRAQKSAEPKQGEKP